MNCDVLTFAKHRQNDDCAVGLVMWAETVHGLLREFALRIGQVK